MSMQALLIYHNILGSTISLILSMELRPALITHAGCMLDKLCSLSLGLCISVGISFELVDLVPVKVNCMTQAELGCRPSVSVTSV